MSTVDIAIGIEYHQLMNIQTKSAIIKDTQIKKFSAYGFLKNLTFFEPYLLVYLMGNGISLLEIGILISIKEIMVNVFEVPSGIIADYFGRKKELCTCFLFYIISFIFFSLSTSFLLAAVAMGFFGLGEAFRSGTHKAMIYTYIEKMNWENHKAYIYGRTRSFSQLGSAISAILGIFIIIYLPKSSYIFLVSIVPYIIDFILIATYPNYLDKSDICNTGIRSVSSMVKRSITNLKAKKRLRTLLYSNGVFESMISCTKDFIQPIFEFIIIGSGILVISSISSENNLKIILGISYFLIHILSALASRNSFRLRCFKTGYWWLNSLYLSLSIIFLLLSILINQVILVLVLFVLMYLLLNLRKPIYVDIIDYNMEKYERATILSFSSQLKSLFTIVMAPIIGYVAGTFGIMQAMMMISLIMLILTPFTIIKKSSWD